MTAEPHSCSYAPDGFLEPSRECLNPGHQEAFREQMETGTMIPGPGSTSERVIAEIVVPAAADLTEAAAIGARLAGLLTSGEREVLARLGAAAGGSR